MGLGSSREKKHRGGGGHGNPKPAAPQSPAAIDDIDRATLMLKLQRDRLSVAQRKALAAAEREKHLAAQYLACGDRSRALYCLRKRKLQERQIESVTQLQLNVQTTLQSIDDARMMSEVLQSLRAGTAALETLNRTLQPEDVEQVVGDAQEAVALHQEIQQLLGEQLGGHDEEEVEAEIAALELQMAPALPSHALPAAVATTVKKGEPEADEETDSRVLA
jgi:DNA-binding FrmR family transcriptional regulator